MLFSVILSLHVVACVLVILVVLLQSGKGSGFSGIFGGGGSDAVFSAPSGSQFIRKATTGFAIAFFITSLLLTFLGSKRGLRSVTRQIAIPAPATSTETTLPAAPKSEPAPAVEKTAVPPKK